MNEKPKTNAIPLENGNYGCPKCKGEQFKHVMHLDGKRTFKDLYNCINCGESVSMEFERDEESMAYWED